MTLKAQLKVMNNVSAEINEITISSNCSNFVELILPPIKDGRLQLQADELREFLWRTEPLKSIAIKP